MDRHELDRNASEVLPVADCALSNQQGHEPHRLLTQRELLGSMGTPDDHEHHGEHRERRDRVDASHVSHKKREAVGDEFVVAAGVRTRPGDDRAGDEQDRAEDEEGAACVAERTVVIRRRAHPEWCRVGDIGLGLLDQHRCVPQQHHRQDEVPHRETRIEVGEHEHGPEQDLGDHAGNKSPRPPDQVASFRPAANRPENGEHDGDRDDPGEETVPEFDERMVFE